MMNTKSESDVTSLAPSSPSRSPKRQIYYVQSPSRESIDGDNKSMQATPMYNSPMDSPLHPAHSRNSSASLFSGVFRSSSDRKAEDRKGSRSRNEKGWPECNVILEEGNYEGVDDKKLSRKIQALIAVLSFVVLFALFCLIIWGASRPYKTQVTLKSLAVHNFYVSEATDFSGVPTKVMTFNGSLKLGIHNPATFFGVHVSSTPITLLYSELPIATGQLQKHYQPRKSHRTVRVVVKGDKVPLYGAGSSIEVSSERSGQVPFMLELEIRSRGDVIGKLVTTRNRLHAFCNVTVDYLSTKPIKFRKKSCSYH